MEQPKYILDTGTRIRTHATLRHSDHFGARHPDKPGKIAGVVGGMGGDVYHVDHDDGARAIYCFDEFEREGE